MAIAGSTSSCPMPHCEGQEREEVHEQPKSARSGQRSEVTSNNVTSHRTGRSVSLTFTKNSANSALVATSFLFPIHVSESILKLLQSHADRLLPCQIIQEGVKLGSIIDMATAIHVQVVEMLVDQVVLVDRNAVYVSGEGERE